jgi:hypothetical protein
MVPTMLAGINNRANKTEKKIVMNSAPTIMIDIARRLESK